MLMFVERFKKGKWLSKSNSMLADKSKVLSVLAILTKYMKKGGLKKVQEDLNLLYGYILEVVQGKYKGYSTSSLTLALAAIIYVISPLDIMPDIIPFTGYIDDIAIVTWAMSKMEEELKRYKENKDYTEFEEIE